MRIPALWCGEFLTLRQTAFIPRYRWILRLLVRLFRTHSTCEIRSVSVQCGESYTANYTAMVHGTDCHFPQTEVDDTCPVDHVPTVLGLVFATAILREHRFPWLPRSIT